MSKRKLTPSIYHLLVLVTSDNMFSWSNCNTSSDIEADNVKLIKQKPSPLHKWMSNKNFKDYQNDNMFF